MEEEAIDSIVNHFTEEIVEMMDRPTLELLKDTLKDNKDNGTLKEFIDELKD